MVVSLSADRRRLIRTAAEAQAWDAIVCRDAGEVLRTAFKRSVPLIVVDLPDPSSLAYGEFKEVVERTKEITSSLMLVVGTGTDQLEEVWARQLGAWAYLCEANSLRGFEFLFGEARQAVERRELLAPAPLEFAWVPLAEVPALTLYPECLRTLALDDPGAVTRHVIERG